MFLMFALISAEQRAFPQGTFVNLDFERARIIPIPNSPYYPYAVATSNALPGWTDYNAVAPSVILYDEVTLGAAAISIHDTKQLH
jgi:hypothetical protein